MPTYKFILLILLCTYWHLAKAQDKDYLELDIALPAQTLSIPQTLEIISHQCGCYFSYPSDLFMQESISIHPAFLGTLQEFIQKYLGANLQAQVYKNQIILQGEHPQKERDSIKALLHIKASIFDAHSGRSIPYASVAIADTWLGTSANGNGYFELKLSPEQAQQEIQISCLGYHTLKITAEELQTLNRVVLTPANISLQEVVVRSVGSQYIVGKAVANFDQYYRQEAYNYRAFYREMAYRNQAHLSYIEALFQGFSPKNKAHKTDLLALQRSRKFSLAPSQQDSILLKLKGGTEAALQLDIVRYRTDFVSDERNALYHYHMVDIVTWNDQLVYIIAFKPINSQSTAQFQGKLYISFEDYILLGADFEYTPKMLKQLRHNLIVHKDRGIKVSPQQYSYHIEYQAHQGLYHFNYVRGDINIKAKHRQSWRYKNFNTTFEMVLTQMTPSPINSIKSQPKHKTNSVLSDIVEFSPQHFWTINNIIVPEQAIMDAFQASGFIIEAQE